MVAKKRLKKKSIREDRLVTTALRVSNYVQEHFAQVISVLVVLIAAVAVILFTAQSRRKGAQAAENELAVAMNIYQLGDKEQAGTSFANLADQYSGRRPGLIAMYFLAECYVAQEKYEEAAAAYRRYVEKAGKNGQFSVAAAMGEAYCYEALKDYPQAGAVLENLSKRMDAKDARYGEVLYSAATFYQEAGEREKARELYTQLGETARGELKNRVDVRLALLE